jgi:hypothetical protein
MTAADERPREGWAMPGNASRFHYFRGPMALCRRWMFKGELDADNGKLSEAPQSKDCRQCWRLRKRELADAE